MYQRFSKLNWKKLFWVVFLLCIAVPLLIAAYQSTSSDNSLSIVVFIAISAFILIVLSSLLVTALPSWNYLEIDNQGFKVKMGPSQKQYSWDQCSQFFRIDISGSIMFGKKERVACNLQNPGKAEDLLKKLSGAHVILLQDYGVNVSDLVLTMNSYRENAVSRS